MERKRDTYKYASKSSVQRHNHNKRIYATVYTDILHNMHIRYTCDQCLKRHRDTT